MSNQPILSIKPNVAAARISRLVDLLLPGDDLFPAASVAGTQGIVLHRLRDRLGYSQLNHLLVSLNGLENLTIEAGTTQITQLETDEPALFAVILLATYTAYYASPLVIEAIRQLGHDYNDSPQPKGYALRKFDTTPGVDLPSNPVGRYKATDEITQLNLSAYPDLVLEPNS